MDKIPLLVELIGEPESGKTHFSLLFPNSILMDTTPLGEGKVIIKKVYPDDWKSRYFAIKSMKDVRKAVVIAKEVNRKTVSIDTSSGLVDLAAREWCIENDKKAVYPIVNYGRVYDKVDMVLSDILDSGINLVLTSGLKDEYKDGEKTGRREHDGYKRLQHYCSIRILLQLKSEGDKWIRTTRVAKNRFRDKAGEDYIHSLGSINFDEIIRLTGLDEEMIIK